MSITKKGFSAKEIQRQLGLKRYEPVWQMTHKLRKAMGKRDARYTLEGMTEMDEEYFTVSSSEIEQSQGIRGRGAVGKANTLIMVESIPYRRYFGEKIFDRLIIANITGLRVITDIQFLLPEHNSHAKR